MYQQVLVKYQLNPSEIENGINRYLIDTLPILPIMSVAKIYWLVI